MTTTMRKITTTPDVVVTANGHAPSTVEDEQTQLVRVPDIEIYQRYVKRRVAGGLEDMQVFDYALAHARNVLIKGPTGPGKTMASRAYAAFKGMLFYSVPCNVGVDPAQLFGKWIVDEDGPRWIDGGITHLARHGGLLLINEINALPAKIAMVIFAMLDDRREITLQEHKGEVVRFHKPRCWCSLPKAECRKRWVLVVADYNPRYAGTSDLNAALSNRFAIQIDWDYDPEVEKHLVKSRTLLEDIAPGLRSSYGQSIFTPTSTNMLEEFEELALDRTMGLDFAIANFVAHYAPEEQAGVALTLATLKDNLVADYASLLDQGPENPHGDTLVLQDGSWIYTHVSA